ncbi:hypothetical protein PLICRDRAFT_38236 [Plicaturopsis crispa FD-325 SS-3]|nr:hypothetical protein PLICRDRAFT_38236 [Plicaturopsis crispa FD-325 SS-3]
MAFPAREHVIKTFEKLVELLPVSERTKPQIILLAGEDTPYRNDTDREIVFRQESNFFYLTGCALPSSYVLLAYQPGTSLAKAPSAELFIPKAEPADIMWSVPPPELSAAQSLYDASNVAHTTELGASIAKHLKAFPDALFHTLPRDSPLFPVLPAAHTNPIVAEGAISDAYLLPALHHARLIKTPAEIALIRQANAISSRAHEVVMRMLGQAVRGEIRKGPGAGTNRPLLPGEWLIEKEPEAEAVFVASCRREGAVHQAYLPIVAASTRASTLHYCCNDREFAWGPVGPDDHHNHDEFAHGKEKQLLPQVLLIDAGCEWDNYASDITRTMPVGNGGKFTPEARDIYELVLDMQKASFSIIKPGVHWDSVQYLCHRILVRRFLKLGIFRSSGASDEDAEAAILQSGVSAAFFPHGLGHSLGMDVHDVPSASKPEKNATIGELKGHESFYTYLRLRLPLEEGMVVTVEPGCYFSPHLLAPHFNSSDPSPFIDRAVLARYESVGGVRIEDVVLITSDGYENLTTVGSATEWVEGVCSGSL